MEDVRVAMNVYFSYFCESINWHYACINFYPQAGRIISFLQISLAQVL
jgi:hypothetical protein